MFSISHLFILLLFVLIILILFSFRSALRSNPGLRKHIRVFLVVILILCESGLQTWYISQNVWKADHSLPLELCGITMILSIIMLITRSRILYSFLYFAGIGGAFVAMLTPNLAYPFPHIRFFLFFTVHSAIIIASLYMTWVEGYKPSWRSLWFTMLSLNVIAAAVWSANYILGANYMFLSHKPDTYSFLNYFGPYPYYLLVEEGFAFVVFLSMFLLFFWLPDRFKALRSKGPHIHF